MWRHGQCFTWAMKTHFICAAIHSVFAITEQVFLEKSGLETFLYHLSGFVGIFIWMPGCFGASGSVRAHPRGFRVDFVSNAPHRTRRIVRRRRNRGNDAVVICGISHYSTNINLATLYIDDEHIFTSLQVITNCFLFLLAMMCFHRAADNDVVTIEDCLWLPFDIIMMLLRGLFLLLMV